ncbi:glucosaminidase domain-containing protein [Candidatus Nomurabacteria bacterium]|nr:glucosaminidase domain-containing protein [Candidatus Nomurabacteria bacterium]
MKKTQITQFLQSFVAIPLFAVTMPLTGGATTTPMIPEFANISSAIVTPLITPEEEAIRAKQAKAIDDFLKERKSPLAGYGSKFVEEAYKNGIDYRLLVAIAGRETTFYRDGSECKNPKGKNNPFGFGSCKIGFKSIDEAIEVVSKKLGGNDENLKHYKIDMTSEQILKKYNPDHIVPGYSKQVVKIMKLIDDSQEIA